MELSIPLGVIAFGGAVCALWIWSEHRYKAREGRNRRKPYQYDQSKVEQIPGDITE